LETSYNTCFNEILKKEQKRLGISNSALGRGIYSRSAVSMIVSGKRIPSKMYRDRLLSRLNVPINNLFSYLQPDEFKSWTIRERIQAAVVSGNYTTALSELTNYENNFPKLNDLEKQFCAIIRTQIYLYKNDYKSAFKECVLAKNYSIKQLDNLNYIEYALCDVEIFILILYKYIELCIKCHSTSNNQKIDIHTELDDFINTISNISNSLNQDMNLIKVYCCSIYYFADTVFKYSEDLYYHDKAYGLVLDSINKLKISGNCFLLPELTDMCTKLYISKSNNYTHSAIFSKNNKCQKVFKYLNALTSCCKLNSLYYRIDEGLCFNSQDIIKVRQNMFGIKNSIMYQNLCDKRTFLEINKKKNRTQRYVLNGAFNLIDMPDFILHGEIITTDYELLRQNVLLIAALNAKKRDLSIKLLNDIENKIDISYSENKLFILNIKITIDIINNIDVTNKVSKAVQTYIISKFPGILDSEKIFLTYNEIVLLTNYIQIMKKNSNIYVIEILNRWYLHSVKNDIYSNFSMVSFVGYCIADIYNELHLFEKSNEIVVLSLKTLKYRQSLSYTMQLLYLYCCNCQKSTTIQVCNKQSKELLNICSYIADFAENKFWRNFFESKLTQSSNNT